MGIAFHGTVEVGRDRLWSMVAYNILRNVIVLENVCK